MCSLVIIGVPGNTKSNFIERLFRNYSINYQPDWEGKDIILTKIDVKKDKTGKVWWEECPGDDCDALRLLLHSVCTAKGINVGRALDELTAPDGLSQSHIASFRELLNKLKMTQSSPSSDKVEMHGMSQVFDFSHKSTAFAQIPVLFTDKKKIITIFVCKEGSTMSCQHMDDEMSLAESVMFWANSLGHFEPGAHNMLVAFEGSSSGAYTLSSDLTSKTKELGIKNIFTNLIFEISQENGMSNLQARLNEMFTKNIEKEMKLSWLVFHSALIKIAKWPWIPYATVKHLAGTFRIGKAELSKVMQFWSSITSILYRDVDRLRDIVFCDTVWLAKELSKVMNLDTGISSLLQYGVVEQCVAEKHWLKIQSSGVGGKAATYTGPHQLLLDYFTGLELATVFSSIEGKQHLQCACYFIPSLLKPCKDALTKNKYSLFVKFPQSFMPLQAFSHIIIHLLRDEYLACGLSKTYLFSNKVSLRLDSCCELILVRHRFLVEIMYACNYCLRPKEEVVKMIRDNIEECCNKLSLEFSFQLMCPNNVHYIRVPEVKTQHVHCRTCASHVTLSSHQLYWIVEVCIVLF